MFSSHAFTKQQGICSTYSIEPNQAKCCVGHEFVALGWILEQASPAIARTLSAIPDVSTAAVVIPDVPGIPPERLYRLFGVAVEFASSSSTAVEETDALDLWAIAAVLQASLFQLAACFHKKGSTCHKANATSARKPRIVSAVFKLDESH